MTEPEAPPEDPTVVVSPMLRRHIPEVVAIEARTYPRPWSAKLFEEELDRRGRCYLVARVGADVVGYAGLLMIADDGHVSTVAVDPDVQGRKVATRLLVELVRGALELGAGQLTLEVRASNRRAQALYGRFGFVPAGARKAYYGDNGEDAIVMWAHDVATDEYAERLASIERSLPSPTVRHAFTPGATPETGTVGGRTLAAQVAGRSARLHPAAPMPTGATGASSAQSSGNGRMKS
ncbi:MAG: ribosomal protein S18-alanine N-acetyltransferase [Acidimicrobiales bacterium]|nr:ribosomal protein S18-alanine N-acetyltransferase [Acidimicrobiales bacterium]